MYRECLSCNDVLLVPRHSDLESRDDCDPKFYDEDLIHPYSLPVVASPMDRVYSKEMDACLTARNIPVIIHRYFHDYKDQLAAALQPKSSELRFFAVGSIKNREWIDGLLEEGIKHFCVDMAHGDTSLCTNTVKYLVRNGADKVIAGNVATKSGFGRLQDEGAWAIRCGIGSGCFTPNTPVMTKSGYKKISEIKIGDIVWTHTGELEEVIDLISYETSEELYKINDQIECTSNHEFYVIHRDHQYVVNESNIHEYARWVRADELSEDYIMIELDNESDK